MGFFVFGLVFAIRSVFHTRAVSVWATFSVASVARRPCWMGGSGPALALASAFRVWVPRLVQATAQSGS